MLKDIALALWFFAPAGMANMTPILVSKLPGLRHWNAPIDGGVMVNGKRLFGDHKTWRGLVTGVIGAIVVLALQVALIKHVGWLDSLMNRVDYRHLNIWLVGFLFGFGALAGDALKSFAKRQVGVKPGHTWIPFDQLDYIVGGTLATAIVVRPPLAVYVWIVLLWLPIVLVSTCLGYLLRLKEQPI